MILVTTCRLAWRYWRLSRKLGMSMADVIDLEARAISVYATHQTGRAGGGL